MNQPDPSAQPTRRPATPRPEVLRGVLDLYDKPRYLEVGVNKGRTFDQVTASEKVAVDPNFLFDHLAAQKQNPGTTYHQVTSDEYFGKVIGPDEQFDVIFLDGLHTFEQTLRDFTNALAHLQPKGIIVIDDVRPSTYVASIPDQENSHKLRKWMGSDRKAWMGDVYKLVWFIDTFYQSLSYRTVKNNHGQAVVWRERRPEVTERTVSHIGALSFEEFALNHDVLHRTDYSEILSEVAAWHRR